MYILVHTYVLIHTLKFMMITLSDILKYARIFQSVKVKVDVKVKIKVNLKEMEEVTAEDATGSTEGVAEIQLYPCSNLALDWGWMVSATPPAALPVGRKPGTHYVRGWVGSRAL